MKASAFKARSIYKEHKSDIRVVMFHGDVSWYVTASAQDFARDMGLADVPRVPCEQVYERLVESQQGQFFSDTPGHFTPCFVCNAESVSTAEMKKILDLVPSGLTLVFATGLYMRPNSGVRQFLEKSPHALLVPLYTPHAQHIASYIRQSVQLADCTIAPSVVQTLSQHLVHFLDQVDRIIKVMTLYHGASEITEQGMQACLHMVSMKPDIIRLVTTFFTKRRREFSDLMRNFDWTATSDVLHCLSLLQDVSVTLLLAKKSLLKPSDARAFKWQEIIKYASLWSPRALCDVLAWVVLAEVDVKRSQFQHNLPFLFYAMGSGRQ